MRRIAYLFSACLFVACGGDDGGSPTTTGVTTIGGGDDSGSTGGASTTVEPTSDGSSSGDAGSSSGETGGSSTAAVDDTAGTTGEPADPEYPAPDDAGMCPEGTAMLDLAGATACAPFCAGADAPCPAAATGTATPECTPFEMPGGSGDPCKTHDECTGGEACGVDGTCVAVAFWGCRLICDAGETCPDPMTCSGVGACGYP